MTEKGPTAPAGAAGVRCTPRWRAMGRESHDAPRSLVDSSDSWVSLPARVMT